MPRDVLLESQGPRDVVDHLSIHPITCSTNFQPATLPQLVGSVRSAEQLKAQGVRAIGSFWAPSEVGTADSIIFTDKLSGLLCQPWSFGVTDDEGDVHDASYVHDASTAAHFDVLRAMSGTTTTERPHLVYVEAGIKIKHLLAKLAAHDLSLPTMGAAGGQSLGGMLSTSTHGSDFETAPLSSWVRAVHLVGPGGQEWWITDRQHRIDPDLLGRLPGWCPDTLIVADDDLLNAVRVTMGRFGVIYSVVLEAVAEYGLISVTRAENWADLRASLLAAIENPKAERPPRVTITNINNGWLYDTLVAPFEGDLPTDNPNAIEVILNPLSVVPIWEANALRKTRRDSLLAVGAMTGVGYENAMHHINIVLSLTDPDHPGCWVERRWRCATPENGPTEPYRAKEDGPYQAPPKGAEAKLIANMYQMAWKPKDFAPWLQKELAVDGGLLADAKSGAVADFRENEIPKICARSLSSMDALLTMLHVALNSDITNPNVAVELGAWFTCTDIPMEAHKKVLSEVESVIAARLGAVLDNGTWWPSIMVGKSSDILDTHDYRADGVFDGDELDLNASYTYERGATESGRTCEFHFDASQPNYLYFLDDLFALATTGTVLGVIGIRFTPKAEALMAMQRYEMTASVEIQFGRNRNRGNTGLEALGADDLDFGRVLIEKTIQAGHARGGTPHWGLEHAASKDATSQAFGQNLTTWSECLATIVGERPDTFSTQFSRDSGLEPAGSAHPLLWVATVTDSAADVCSYI